MQTSERFTQDTPRTAVSVCCSLDRRGKRHFTAGNGPLLIFGSASCCCCRFMLLQLCNGSLRNSVCVLVMHPFRESTATAAHARDSLRQNSKKSTFWRLKFTWSAPPRPSPDANRQPTIMDRVARVVGAKILPSVDYITRIAATAAAGKVERNSPGMRLKSFLALWCDGHDFAPSLCEVFYQVGGRSECYCVRS